MSTLRKITPSSIGTPYKERYEYLLTWISPNGGLRSWFFNSTQGDKSEDYKSEVIDTIADFRSIPNTEDIEIELQTKGLSFDDFNYVSSILKSNRTLVIAKDLTTTPIAIKSGKKITENIRKDFEFKLKIMLQEPDLMNV